MESLDDHDKAEFIILQSYLVRCRLGAALPREVEMGSPEAIAYKAKRRDATRVLQSAALEEAQRRSENPDEARSFIMYQYAISPSLLFCSFCCCYVVGLINRSIV